MMKKIIALALALSMALSMVAFAGYTDAAEINADLAGDIELVGALGIMQGNTDGSFNPTGTLTRGEAATILYRLSSGKSTIDASWADASLTTLTDVNGHWSAPYVNYCAALGLIAGYTDGTFRPDNNVTGAEMAKMLLNVLGYSTEKQGYGKNWPMPVLADATNCGLLDEYEQAFTASATREWVAKMLSNLLGVKTVAYNTFTDALEESNTTFGAKKYSVKSVELYALANEFVSMNGVAKTAEDSEQSKLGAAIDATSSLETIDFVVDSELVGHLVKVYYKTGDTTALEDAAKIYAVVDAADTIIETTIDKVYANKLSGSTGLIVNGKNVDDAVDSASDVTFYENLTKKASAPIKTATSSSSAFNNDNRSIKLVYQGEKWYGFYNKVEYAQAPADFDWTEDEITLGSLSAVDAEYVNFSEEVVEDDIVEIETLNDGTYNVTKINPLRTKITSTSGTSSFVAAGTTYKVAKTPYDSFAFSSYADWPTDNEALKANVYDVYTNGKYVVWMDLYEGDVVSGLNMNVVYLIAGHEAEANNAFSNDSDKVQVMFADGAIAVYEYYKATSVTGKAFDDLSFDSNGYAADGTVYEYVMNDDGTIYFKDVTANASVGAYKTTVTPDEYLVKATLAKSFLTVDGIKLYANEDAFFFAKYVVDGENYYAVIKASEIEYSIESGDDWAFGDLTTYITDENTGLSNLVYGVMLGTDDELPVKSTSGEYFITTGGTTKVVDEDGVTYTVKGINANGEAVTLVLASNMVGTADEMKDATDESDIVAGTMYTVQVSGEDTYLSAGAVASKAATTKKTDLTKSASYDAWYITYITATNGDFVILDDKSGDLIDLAEDCNIYALNKSGSSFSKGTVKELTWSTEYPVLVKLDADGLVSDIIYFNYRTASTTVVNGETVSVDYEPSASVISVLNIQYK